MTRFSDDSDFVDPRALVAQTPTDNTYPTYNNMTASAQPQFADYVMPPVPGRVASVGSSGYAPDYGSGSYDPSYGNEQRLAQSMRNQQLALSMEMTGNSFGSPMVNASYGWHGGQNPQSMYWREMQQRRMWQQEETQEALYYNAVTPRYQPSYRNYDYSANWNSGTIYTPGAGYVDGGYATGYAPRPLYDQGAPAAPDYSRGYPEQGATMVPGRTQDYSEDSFPAQSRGDRRPAQQATSGGWSDYDFNVYDNLKAKAQALSGHSVQEFNKNIPVRLGCARAVSELVSEGYGFDVKDVSVHGLEKTLKNNGFTEVSIADMQPGDVICAYRKPGDYGHAAVYMGNGQIFNNDSDAGKMEIQSIAKYNKAEFKHFVILHRPARVPAVQGDSARTATASAAPATKFDSVDSDDQTNS